MFHNMNNDIDHENYFYDKNCFYDDTICVVSELDSLESPSYSSLPSSSLAQLP